MDTIIISELAVFFNVGVPEAEREQPQQLSLSVEMELDFSAAAAADDIGETIDYFTLSRRLIGFGHGRSWKLIETLAVDIADMVLRDFGPERVTVEVKKFIIPESKFIAVRVTRPQ